MTENVKSQNRVADTVIKLAKDAGMELFRDKTGDTYARITVKDHSEVHRINSSSFKNWLQSLYFAETEHGVGTEPMQDVRDNLEAEAAYNETIEDVFVRVGHKDGKVYLDLGDTGWRVVEVDEDSWRVLEKSPVNFRRTKGMLSIPEPVHGGKIDELRPFVSVTDDGFIMAVSWLLSVFQPSGGYPILVLIGHAGMGKTFIARILSMLVDPREPATITGIPNQEAIALRKKNAKAIVYDNLSHVPDWFSDLIATTSTGGGSAKRKNYTDDEESLFNGKNPQILTGINDLLTKADALSRALLVTPSPITKRRKEQELLREFEQARPRILGAILDGVCMALTVGDSFDPDELSRMADFESWVNAAEMGIGWEHGTFSTVYNSNRASADVLALEASPVATALQELMIDGCSDGTSSDWLERLNAQLTKNSEEKTRYSKEWPHTPIALSNALSRIETSLQAVGITIARSREAGTGVRKIQICRNRDDSCDGCDNPEKQVVTGLSRSTGQFVTR